MKINFGIKTDTTFDNFHIEFIWQYENELHFMQTWRHGHNTICHANKQQILELHTKWQWYDRECQVCSSWGM